MTERIVTADRGDGARRLDLMLCRHLQDVDRATRTRVQGWIENGCVSVNGVVVRRVAARTAVGDVVVIMLPVTPPRAETLAEDVPLQIVFEDEHLLMLDKPAGVVVHPTYRNMTGTLLNAVLWHARQWPAGQRPSIVGRLDKHTSGLVVVAKSPVMHAALQRELSSSRTGKDYLAVVHGRVPPARGEIDLPLGRDPGDRRRVIVSRRDGAPSVTRFERLARTGKGGAPFSLLRCRLITGRTHQIRVHLAARDWPLVGDATYRGSLQPAAATGTAAGLAGAFPRQALHAWRLSVTHPVTRRQLEVEAPVPRDIDELLTGLALNLLFLRHMTTKQNQPPQDDPSLQKKNPDDWKTGDEPMTASQRSYLETLASDSGESFDENLSKADASKLIDELKQKSPRLSNE